MDLGSGFVLALLIAAVLLADRLGGEDEWALRVFQVALGLSLALAVIAGTSAFILQDSQFDSSIGSGDTRDAANRLVLTAAVTGGLGVMSLLFGLGGMAKWKAAPPGIAFGGILLLIGGSGEYTGIESSMLAASFTVNTVLFVFSIVGFMVLYWYGFDRWDRARTTADEESPDDALDSDT